MDPTVSPAFIVGLIATAVGLGACVGLFVVAYRVDRRTQPDGWTVKTWRERRQVCRVIRWAAVAFTAATLAVAALAFYPYRWAYHSYAPVDGTVTAIDPRQVRDGNGMMQVYAVRYPDGRVYRCDDTRCAGVVPGDRLRLRCIREWDWVADDGWRCAFIRHWPAAGLPR